MPISQCAMLKALTPRIDSLFPVKGVGLSSVPTKVAIFFFFLHGKLLGVRS